MTFFVGTNSNNISQKLSEKKDRNPHKQNKPRNKPTKIDCIND